MGNEGEVLVPSVFHSLSLFSLSIEVVKVSGRFVLNDLLLHYDQSVECLLLFIWLGGLNLLYDYFSWSFHKSWRSNPNPPSNSSIDH